jgi:hypothetical protein
MQKLMYVFGGGHKQGLSNEVYQEEWAGVVKMGRHTQLDFYTRKNPYKSSTDVPVCLRPTVNYVDANKRPLHPGVK